MAFSNVWTPKLGLDLSGGMQVTLTADSATGKVSSESLQLARQIIQRRVDAIGVGESEVTTSGDRQIVVSVPNVTSEELAKMVGQTAQLNFRKVYQAESAADSQAVPTLPQPVESPRPSVEPTATPTEDATASASPGATASATPGSSASPSSTATGSPEEQRLDKLLAWKPSERDTKDFQSFKCGDNFPDVSTEPLITCDKANQYKYLLGPVLIKGEQVSRANAGVPQNSVAWEVELEFKPEGAEQFRIVTGHLNEQTSPQNQFGIVLDGEVISAPQVTNGAITGGRASITGSFTQQSATELANVLSFGALPLSFTMSNVESISPKLGGEQLEAGIIAGIIGLLLVVLYCLLYYRGLAMVVTLSLVVAGLLTWAMVVLLGQSVGFALNLPGIAGAIVAIGVTADSFIVYFERIRDEVREGRGLRTAIETGWVRSRRTIMAADSISLLSAVVLFVLSFGSIQGFAFTLGLTTLIDLAVVFFFTKPMMTLLGRTKFFGQGHRFSGFEAEHMGASKAPLHNSRRRIAATAGGQA
ncbi:MAG: protein translocase subunit SecD [Propionibacteriaceae bacterium]|nr:protein translocase subunit SecD [Propionibacteriaceae bacterium]